MRLVDKEAVYAELFKSYKIIFFTLIIQLFKLCFQFFSALFKGLDGKPFPSPVLKLCNTCRNLFDLLL